MQRGGRPRIRDRLGVLAGAHRQLGDEDVTPQYASYMSELTLDYPAILDHFGKHHVPGRLESRAFLGWFLENYFRLEQSLVDDAICDGPDDKGIDGLYVDTTLEVIYVFQTKLFQNVARSLGDSTLKEFAGTLTQLEDGAAVERLEQTTGNVELRGLIREEKLASRVRSGYEVRGVFVTNASLDANGERFLIGGRGIDVYDRRRLRSDWLPLGDADPVSAQVSFHLDGLGVIRYETQQAKVYVASLRATELIRLDGIESQALFSWNVRQSLGRTKVNKAIAESVSSTEQHRNFMFFHNGLTILANDVSLDEDADILVIDRYSVVNGAQSLSTLFDKKDLVTDELRLLSRVVRLPQDSDLGAVITRNSNNQNAISARDMQSNSVIQKRLKEDFHRTFSTAFGYEVKRGEKVDSDYVITNEEAAKALLAFDLEQPWSCHQQYRYFDDLHSDIFGRPVVTAARIVGVIAVRDAVLLSLAGLDNRLVASYSVAPYFLMYLVKAALLLDDEGKLFCQNPGSYVLSKGFDAVVHAVRVIADDLVVDLNAELAEREEGSGAAFDHKRELKSASAVRALKGQILPSYEKAIKRNRASGFSVEWSLIGAGGEDGAPAPPAGRP